MLYTLLTSLNIRHVLGVLCIELAALLVVPAIVSMIYSEPTGVTAFIASALVSAVLGLSFMVTARSEGALSRKEAVWVIVLAWLIAILIGALPYCIEGMDAASGIFESASGWSAMGGTVLLNTSSNGYYILDNQPESIMGLLFWRALQQLIGGLGIILVIVAVVTHSKSNAHELYHAEAIGTEEAKTPLVSNSIVLSRILWVTYLGLNLVETGMLKLTGMSWYDAITHAMATVATGGYSPYGNSIAQFNNVWVEVITAVFIVLGGSNLGLVYQSIQSKTIAYLYDEEFKFAVLIMAIATAIVALFGNIQADILTTIRYASYTVISFGYTCGFANTMTYNDWSLAAKLTLIASMLIGGCLGSTAGGIKMGRILVCLKYMDGRLGNYFHPSRVNSIKVNGYPVKSESVTGIVMYALLYMGIWMVTSIMLACAEHNNVALDLVGILAAVASALAGVGPAFSQIWASYCYLTAASKLILAAAMYLGRLEMLPLLAIYLNRR